MTEELTSKEFEEYIKAPVAFIDFFAEWCMPCMMMTPIIEDLADEFQNKVKVGKINVDDYEDLASKYNVSSIPTFIIFKNGKPVKQMTGSMTQDELSEELNSFL
ncbi:MAG: thioredoxin [Bacteroidales bacterium]|nr:thioredoxin [Bacteroidales bacterium]